MNVHGGRRPRPALVVASALALQALLQLAPATLGGQVFFRRDVHLMWYAQADVHRRAADEGSRPLWNPSVSFGQSLIADANNQAYYPPTLLLRVLHPWSFYTLYGFGHLCLAGWGAALLGRRLGLGALPAWSVGALWMGSGPLLSLVDTWNQLAGAAWMPWAIVAGLRCLAGRGLGPALAWSAVTALQVVSGSPEMALLAIVAVTVLTMARLRRCHLTWEKARPAALGTALATVLALGLAACQWVPALDAARRAGRLALPPAARTHWSVHPLQLAQAVLPLPLHRVALNERARTAVFGAPDPFLPSIYSGIVAAALVAAALSRPSRVAMGLAAACALSVLLALGRHAWLYEALVMLAPPLHALRYPAKALLLASLAWNLLCGFGLAGLTDPRRLKAAAIAAATLALGAAALCGGLAFGSAALLERFLAASGVIAARPLALRVGAAALLATLTVLLARRGAAARRAIAAAALVDLTLAHLDLNPTAPAALYTHRPPALETALPPEHGRLLAWDYMEPGASRRHLGRAIPYLLARAPVGWDLRAAQALGLRDALFPPSAAPWGADGSYDRDVPGLEPAPLALLKEAFRHASPADRLRLLRLGAVSRVTALHPAAGEGLVPLGRYEGYFVDPVLVFGVPGTRPRAYVVGKARLRPSDAEALAALLAPDFEPEREVVLSSGTAGGDDGFAGVARVVGRQVDRVVIETEMSGPGWLVLVDAWDPGWRVAVDGRPAELHRANLAFRGVALPGGRHDVEFVYRPCVAEQAWWISAASLAALAGLAWLARSRTVMAAAPPSTGAP